MSQEELESMVEQRRQRAYTDMCFDYTFKSTDLDSPNSTLTGTSVASSDCSVAGDVSERWADTCDSDDDNDDLPMPPPSLPSRPAGTWFLPHSMPAATWILPPGCAQTVEQQPQQAKISCDPCDRTTVVLRKLSKSMTRASLLEILEAAGLKGSYDFVYLPVDFKTGKAFGYAIVNFVTNELAEQAISHFAGVDVNIDWSDSHHGFDDLIQRYRDSPIMNRSKPETSKPIIFCNGLAACFPSPTRVITSCFSSNA